VGTHLSNRYVVHPSSKVFRRLRVDTGKAQIEANLMRFSCETWRCGDQEPRKRIVVLIVTFNFSLCTTYVTSPLDRDGKIAESQLVFAATSP
jgi:hypothetical protein